MNEPSSSVTERNQRRLRDAAERLLAGRATVSNGKLTLKSLAEEAGVPRPYLYRAEYKSIAEDFEEQTLRIQMRGTSPDPRVAEIEHLRSELAKVRGRAKRHHDDLVEARKDVKKAATQIAYLTEQTRALREELNAAQNVVSLAGRAKG
ncbi:hypothetical protein [Leifsonia sp. Leaf264]|uniref:hypothetical protein n=1 Tax=Leifsonia sp. Leaf264 TaxID=1736314 RepID=UPI0007018117|nr:hypothetical protein [Leifsonia sp. Leaf264]KQP01950.1 hypothetical protein ASF30_05195 [Leifsonia sp. Leaf264]